MNNDILIGKLELLKEHLNKTMGIEYRIEYMVIALEVTLVKIIIHNRRTAGFQSFMINSDYIINEDYLEVCKSIMKIRNV